MTTLTCLHDVHIGAVRTAGTTPFTQFALRKHILSRFQKLLPVTGDLVLLGDLFDTSNIPVYDVLETYKILAEWLESNNSRVIYSMGGNHDLSKTSNVLSSYNLLASLLERQFPERFINVAEPALTPYGYMIPHLPNQDLFNLALKSVPECETLFLHVNIDNNFAAQSDQSLNMSREQIAECKAEKIVCAHEHNTRTLDKVILPGCQVPTSVSDWITDKDKYYLRIVDDVPSLVCCARRASDYTEMDWKELSITDHLFVRVVGEAEPEEVSSAISAINKLRLKHPAFVITNAIKTTSVSNTDAAMFSESLQSVQAFSVKAALANILNAKEMKVVESLL